MQTLWTTFLQRSRADFRLGIMAVFAACAAVAIAPFALLRAAQSQWGLAALDVLVTASIAGPALYAWRGGSVERAGVVLWVAAATGATATVLIQGDRALFWLFPALVSGFFLVEPNRAGVASLALATLVAVAPGLFEASHISRPTLLASLGLTVLFAWIFAQRTGLHRDALEQQATRDPLTGALNRRSMDTALTSAVVAHARDAAPVALALLDLDHFKRINDVHGHAVGDAVLVAFARLSEAQLGNNARLFRFGGEEFVLLFTDTSAERAERELQSLCTHVREGLRAQHQPVTVSAGLALLDSGESVAKWLARADAALYTAKQTGRDRVVVAPIMTAADL